MLLKWSELIVNEMTNSRKENDLIFVLFAKNTFIQIEFSSCRDGVIESKAYAKNGYAIYHLSTKKIKHREKRWDESSGLYYIPLLSPNPGCQNFHPLDDCVAYNFYLQVFISLTAQKVLIAGWQLSTVLNLSMSHSWLIRLAR